ncbi:hypothetical protein NMY22_g19096 [Coprinellus aureogranulatus]|nr:hypothetical protein NMY22_g19096 [Coprinellus aureogranulatus]
MVPNSIFQLSSDMHPAILRSSISHTSASFHTLDFDFTASWTSPHLPFPHHHLLFPRFRSLDLRTLHVHLLPCSIHSVSAGSSVRSKGLFALAWDMQSAARWPCPHCPSTLALAQEFSDLAIRTSRAPPRSSAPHSVSASIRPHIRASVIPGGSPTSFLTLRIYFGDSNSLRSPFRPSISILLCYTLHSFRPSSLRTSALHSCAPPVLHYALRCASGLSSVHPPTLSYAPACQDISDHLRPSLPLIVALRPSTTQEQLQLSPTPTLFHFSWTPPPFHSQEALFHSHYSWTTSTFYLRLQFPSITFFYSALLHLLLLMHFVVCCLRFSFLDLAVQLRSALLGLCRLTQLSVPHPDLAVQLRTLSSTLRLPPQDLYNHSDSYGFVGSAVRGRYCYGLILYPYLLTPICAPTPSLPTPTHSVPTSDSYLRPPTPISDTPSTPISDPDLRSPRTYCPYALCFRISVPYASMVIWTTNPPSDTFPCERMDTSSDISERLPEPSARMVPNSIFQLSSDMHPPDFNLSHISFLHTSDFDFAASWTSPHLPFPHHHLLFPRFRSPDLRTLHVHLLPCSVHSVSAGSSVRSKGLFASAWDMQSAARWPRPHCPSTLALAQEFSDLAIRTSRASPWFSAPHSVSTSIRPHIHASVIPGGSPTSFLTLRIYFDPHPSTPLPCTPVHLRTPLHVSAPPVLHCALCCASGLSSVHPPTLSYAPACQDISDHLRPSPTISDHLRPSPLRSLTNALLPWGICTLLLLLGGEGRGGHGLNTSSPVDDIDGVVLVVLKRDGGAGRCWTERHGLSEGVVLTGAHTLATTPGMRRCVRIIFGRRMLGVQLAVVPRDALDGYDATHVTAACAFLALSAHAPTKGRGRQRGLRLGRKGRNSAKDGARVSDPSLLCLAG